MSAGTMHTLELPAEITPDLEEILGSMCFEFIRIAELFRASGIKIEKRAKAEQAYCIFWLLRLYAQHGAGWRDAANAELNALAKARSRAHSRPADADPARADGGA